MRLVLLLVTLTTGFTFVSGQTRLKPYNVDSLRHLLMTSAQDSNRVWLLVNLGREHRASDTTILLAEEAIELSKRLNFIPGQAEAYNNIAYRYNQKGNYPRALAVYLKSIQLSESAGYEAGLKRSFNSISTVYLYMKDYTTSIAYARKARALSIKLKDPGTQALAASWMSKSFIEFHRVDSALKYAQESYQLATRVKHPFPLYLSSARLGEISIIEANIPLAIEYSRMSVRYSLDDGWNFRIAGAYQQLAECFDISGQKDSSKYYADKAFTVAKKDNLSATLLKSSLLLSKLYEGVDDSQSLQYHKLALVTQDSLFSQERTREVGMLSLNETLRQQELEKARLKAAEDRKHNIQYAAISLGVVAFAILFLLLSRSVLANERLIKFLTILALLIVFEFANLVLHPFIGNLTHHSPFLMLLFMVAIAALLIPMHHKLEKLISHRLVEKNKEIRLRAAKKVVAELENKV